MTYTDAIEQAIQRQLEIERKAAAWDALTATVKDRDHVVVNPPVLNQLLKEPT